MTEALIPQVVEYLSDQEEQELDKYENEVISHSNNALDSARKAGEALSVIKEKKLWAKARKGADYPVYGDFAEYAKARFGKGKTMSYNYVAVFNVMKAMEDEGLDPMLLGSIQNTLQVHHELRRLTRVNKELNPLFREILSKGITLIENICPIDESTGELLVTPESVRAAFDAIGQIAATGAYEVDGEQFPISLGQVAIDEQASRQMYEQIQRRRLLAAEDAKQNRKRIFEPKPEFTPIQAPKEYKTVYLVCPLHGTVTGKTVLVGGIGMSCGCKAILQLIDNSTVFVHFAGENNEHHNG